jgi:4-amino-4-deoxy-L-arabinose transferase-like glycosyltransferase
LKKPGYIVPALLLLSFFIKLILAVTLDAEMRSDSLSYIEIAYNVINNGEYVFDGIKTAFIVPGYPLFLAAIYSIFGDGQFAVRIIQSLIEILTGYLFFLISLKFFSRKYALISFAVFIFLPSNILYSQMVLTESLFGLFYILIIWLMLRNNSYSGLLFLGITCGIGILIRSSFSFILILVPLIILVKELKLETNTKKRVLPFIKKTCFFITGALIFLGPWVVRNKIVLDEFTISTQGGSALWEGNNPVATGTYSLDLIIDIPLRELQERNDEFKKLAIDFIKQNPHKFLILGVKKIAYLFSSERLAILYFIKSEPGETSTDVYRAVNPFIIAVVNVPYFIITLAGFWGLLTLKKHTLIIYTIFLAWLCIFFTFIGLSRYHYVLIPFLIIGAVNLMIGKSEYIKNLSLAKKIIAAAMSVLVLATWAAEFYLLYFKG